MHGHPEGALLLLSNRSSLEWTKPTLSFLRHREPPQSDPHTTRMPRPRCSTASLPRVRDKSVRDTRSGGSGKWRLKEAETRRICYKNSQFSILLVRLFQLRTGGHPEWIERGRKGMGKGGGA
uniref:Uncharacterized protein n=1 Tax=Chromera velia CCMP2878 TaxID=1169474 RepID=A0A0G4IG04_9ALVE|eukprot:Cvel_2511.t1-p1 / transcript=Cvel_2511.t1 / gene=Cvel_2511 / organism=Chromera_velia_CCMP2878 / gene_product=hypothetical protein / transcript_product=hypothetical protein / location=Cvel_scaffold99:10776-13829(+) / protein_length=121 / sequence_SO=supercontig / SO=protein_coding / is_pseudo=false